MVNRLVTYILEFIGVGGIVALMAYIPWTKMALGGALTVLGAFFPSLKDGRQTLEGNTQLAWKSLILSAKGGVRLGVVLGGIVLIVGAVLDGHEALIKDQPDIVDRIWLRVLSEQQRIKSTFGTQGSKEGLTVLDALRHSDIGAGNRRLDFESPAGFYIPEGNRSAFGPLSKEGLTASGVPSLSEIDPDKRH